jgi:hypothetical protein
MKIPVVVLVTIRQAFGEIYTGTKKVSILMLTFFNTLVYIRTNQPPGKLL